MAKRAIYFKGIQRMLEEGSHSMEGGVCRTQNWPPAASILQSIAAGSAVRRKECGEQGLRNLQGLAGEQGLTRMQWPGLPKECE